jgi:TonB family protein
METRPWGALPISIYWLSPRFRGILVAGTSRPGVFRRPFFVHTVHSESRPELELQPRIPPPPVFEDPERTRKRLLLALGVLLVALAAVILKNWDFWFPPTAEQEYARVTAGKKDAKVAGNAIPSRQRTSSSSVRNRKPVEASNPASTAMAATTERAALPDLQVEVIAGNQRKTVTARSNAIHLDLAPAASERRAPVTPQATMASSANQVQMSPQTVETVSSPVAPEYPLLARQMKVQGAVILQALISRDGSIQELQIVKGPAILADAAREAVKQWRFRPFYQNGQPVQTQARITVNFTISTN